jgi:hypothetical protein
MVIDGTAKFQCGHEYVNQVGVPYLVCHKCLLHTDALHGQTVSRKSLLFFPTSVREMQAEAIAKAANG